MNKALQPTWEAEWIASHFVDKVKNILKSSWELRKVPKKGINPRSGSSPCPRLTGKYSRFSQLCGSCFHVFPRRC